MDVYVSKLGLAQLVGVHRNQLDAPAPDVIIGRSRGWSASRVTDSGITAGEEQPRRLLAWKDVIGLLRLSKRRVAELRDDPESGFPPPAACIQSMRPGQAGGWQGHVYGWERPAVTTFAEQTGRTTPVQTGRRGRPPGSGDYEALPRCLRPCDSSVHGKGHPCQAVRRKTSDAGQPWAPACGIHLTDAERHTLGLPSRP